MILKMLFNYSRCTCAKNFSKSFHPTPRRALFRLQSKALKRPFRGTRSTRKQDSKKPQPSPAPAPQPACQWEGWHPGAGVARYAEAPGRLGLLRVGIDTSRDTCTCVYIYVHTYICAHDSSPVLGRMKHGAEKTTSEQRTSQS